MSKPQFDTAQTHKHRHLERWLIHSHSLHAFAVCCCRVVLSSLYYPRYIAPFRWQLRQHPMPLPRLSPAFEGYKILFLSDLHVGKTQQKYLHRTLTQLVQTKPDLILLGGDLIDYHPKALPLLADTLPLLQAPDGVFTIFGNHDYHEYSSRHVGERSAKRAIHKRLVRIVEQSHVRLLRNELVTITRPTGRGAEPAKLQIVGMDEIWSTRADAKRAFSQVDPQSPTLCLLHNPDGYELIEDYPWDWVLCGHSHGGQIHLPLVGPLYVPMKYRHRLRGFYPLPYPSSTPSDTPRMMYVSTGLGYSTPLRVGVPPEATLFTLTSKVIS